MQRIRLEWIIVLMLACTTLAQNVRREWKLEFGTSHPLPGFVGVHGDEMYSAKRGYGFEPGAVMQEAKDGCWSEKPFYFSIALPEGNYRVRITLGGEKESTTTVKAELRRLMLENIHTQPAETVSRNFCVNIRTPKIAGDGTVHLKPREKQTEMWDWDDKLTLEFDGENPGVVGVEISPADDLPVIYLLGDSTVCDQPSEPWNSWGQMLPRFFKPEVVVANNAESGESLRSSLAAHRLDKVLSTMKEGDYLFIQYGHNDMKEKGPGVGAFTTYKSDLEFFVDQTRKHGGTPVLITSMERKAGVLHDTLGDYPAAVRKVAGEKNVALIDLNAMSKKFYRALGTDLSKAFVDGTHHNNYGSYELAKCVIEGIRQDHLPIAKYIVDGVLPFDPSHPDAIATFNIPASARKDAAKPLGN
ncbi:MAG TPA: rhamnogalacturonan acetylesterase [Tepidisphaeraceae bacterium]|jgi:lysophospholipase L1-like esterase